MRGVNEVTIIGNLGNDPEVRYTQSGAAITTISVATSERWKDKNGEQQEKTSWHRIKFFGRLAEIAGEYLKKGSQVYVEGSLRYGSYEKEGVTHYTTDVIADEMQMLGGRSEGGERAPRREAPARDGAANRSQGAPLAKAKVEPGQASDFGDDFNDDDIPF